MLCVYMIRHFQCELAEHVAQTRGGERAVKLDPKIRRAFGIGNATGLGMAPFLVRHPILIHHWVAAKETALARVLAVETATAADQARFRELLDRARSHVAEWNVEEPRQQDRIETLRSELATIASSPLTGSRPWKSLYETVSAQFSLEAQELVAALLIELYPELVDSLVDEMSATQPERVDGSVTVGTIRDIIEREYRWALNIDFDDQSARKFFWYYSEAKEEPRLGKRFEEPGAEREMRLGVGHMVKQLSVALTDIPREQNIATFLLKHPEWRLAVRRIETTRRFPYAEIRDNTVGANLLPIDLLRCKLAFFGATKFDPKSDLWTRITMYQGAPLIGELQKAESDDWWLPAWLS
jgi:hypothetical protein